MHRALKTPDIVRDIFAFLSPVLKPESGILDHIPTFADDYWTHCYYHMDYQTLFNSALTCRAFVCPSLDTLWSAMDDLTPLFQLIPAFQTTGEGSGNFEGLLCKEDFKIFNNYARRIRILSLDDEIPTSTYLQTMHINQCTTILPNLQVLIVSDRVRPGPEIAFFLTPRLRSIHFYDWDTTETTFSSFLTTLAACAVDLNSLVSIDQEVPEASWPCIARLQELERLLIPNGLHIGHDFLKRFPFAERLIELRVASITFQTPIRAPPAHSFFPRLRILHVSSAVKILQMTTLLMADHFSQLESLQFGVFQENQYVEADEDHWKKFFQLLGEHNSNSLRRLHISLSRPILGLDKWARPGIDISTSFSKLFGMNLTHVCLQFPLLETVTAMDIQLIIDSWPMIEHLELATRRKRPINGGDLITIAESLPHLKILGLGVDGKDISILENVPILSHRLEWLILANSRPWNSRVFARHVDKLFPFVDVLRGDGERVLENSAFDKIKDFISSFQATRNDERIRLGLVRI